MAGAKVAFLSGLPRVVVDVITPYTPEGWTTDVIDAGLPQEEQNARLKDADFIMVYRSRLTDEGLRGAAKSKLVQLLAAGYDSMNLRLMRDLEVPCANNGGANSYAVADHAVIHEGRTLSHKSGAGGLGDRIVRLRRVGRARKNKR